jgi:hypothetical protein
MENNINLRNQYIKKVQDRVDKLLYSINLLDNLNEVISQKGGAGAADGQAAFNAESINNNFTEINDINNFKFDDFFMPSDKKIKILENEIEELNISLNRSQVVGEIKNLSQDDANTRLIKALEDIKQKTKELEDINKLLVEEQTKSAACNIKVESLTTLLQKFNTDLEALKKNVPNNTTLEKYNNNINAMLSMIESIIDKKNSIDTFITTKLKYAIDDPESKLIIEIFTSIKEVIGEFTNKLTALRATKEDAKTKFNEFTQFIKDYNNIIKFMNLLDQLKIYKKGTPEADAAIANLNNVKEALTLINNVATVLGNNAAVNNATP